MGDHRRYTQLWPDKMFLFDIVNNQKSGFDLDKLDYINRDLVHTKINLSQIGYKRIISNARVVEDKIAYNKKVISEVNLVFSRR